MTWRIFAKLILGLFCVLLVALAAVDFFASRVAESNYIHNLTRALAEKGRILSLTIADPTALPRARLEEMAKAADARITIVRPDGTVLADSDANPAEMENHRTRPELMQAFRGVEGSSIRHSATIGVNFLYVALPIPAGALRLAMPLSEINAQVSVIRHGILASTAFAFLPAIIVAALLARLISHRFAGVMDFAAEIAKGNFRALPPRRDKSEFGQLASRLSETAENLQRTVEQLQAEHNELERVERVRKDFVINVSHELRTPLASIQGYAETLMDGALYDGEHNMRFLGIIRHNAERLARLTSDLLSLSRIELRRQEFHFDSYDIGDLLTEALDILRPVAGKKNVRLAAEAPAAGTEAWCDAEAVSQILSNLVDNAIKYTPEGGTITVGARVAAPWLDVFVRDTGVGIPPEDLPRLFERFYRVDKARSRELGGTGLGLAIVKHLVLAQGGQVRVESGQNQGTAFWFTLPIENTGTPSAAHLNSEFTPS